MNTVTDVSKLTGISVRTLHYYDNIGLCKPTMHSESGYRLYDDKALEKLQQILYFKEFDIPLKEIKSIMENPGLDRNCLLKSQREMLLLKKQRLERIINSIDDILKGDNKMDFKVFDKDDIDRMYRSMEQNMTEQQKEIFIKEHGSMEAFEKHFKENAKSEKAQKNFAKIVEWYGDKESAMEAAVNPNNSQIMDAYSKRYENTLHKLASKMDYDINTFEVKEIVGELEFVTKQLYQLKDARAFMLETAQLYKNDKTFQKASDETYGQGATKFIGEAIEAFYKNNT